MTRTPLLPVLIWLVVTLNPIAGVAQKENSCDRELKDSSKVVLRTPVELSGGRICLDDGDSFGIGNAWVRLRGIDAPNIARNCLKSFDALPPRCEKSKGAIQALLVLSELLEAGTVCEANKIGYVNRWPVDCTSNGYRSLALEMIKRGFACASNGSIDELKSADFEACKQKVGLWAGEWADKLAGFPSGQCSLATRRYANHVKYLERKARKAAVPAQ